MMPIENLEDVENTLSRAVSKDEQQRYDDAMREHARVCKEARATAATQELKVLECDDHACSGYMSL